MSICAKASGRSRPKVEAHIAVAAPINFEICNVRYSPKSRHWLHWDVRFVPILDIRPSMHLQMSLADCAAVIAVILANNRTGIAAALAARNKAK